MTTGRSLLLLLSARTSAPLLPPVAGGGTADRIGIQVIHDPGRRLQPVSRSEEAALWENCDNERKTLRVTEEAGDDDDGDTSQ